MHLLERKENKSKRKENKSIDFYTFNEYICLYDWECCTDSSEGGDS